MKLTTAIAALAIAGCGSGFGPAPRVADTAAAIRAADESGARKVPRAALHLALAKDQMRIAQSLIADGNSDEARVVLERARADAELARTLTHEARYRREAQKALARVRDLEQSHAAD